MSLLKSVRPHLIWVVIAALVLVSISTAKYFENQSGKVKTFPGTGEQILMDELSLWHGQANSGISYGEFEPLRVRDEGAEYFPRTDGGNKEFAASGRRYGEVKLTQNDGGLLYLPRHLSYSSEDSLKMRLRQSSIRGQWQISVYTAIDQVARFSADTPGISLAPAGSWTEITIPLALLKTEKIERVVADRQKERDPNYLLSLYNVPSGELYGIGFAVKGGKSGDSLFIDRLVLQKPVHTDNTKLTGNLRPFLVDANIILRSDKGDTQAKAGLDGTFTIDIPQGAKIVEVVAEKGGKVMSPRSGRFIEIGTYLSKITIPTDDAVLEKGTKEDNANHAYYIYESKYGPRMQPNHHFLVKVSIMGDQVAAAELKTNKLGYIDRDRRPENPDNAFRMMILGDSHHMGVHLAQEDHFWNEAEALATMKAQRPVEVINAAFHVAAFTSSWPAFRDFGKEIKPDLTVIPLMDPVILNLAVTEFMARWLGASMDHRPSYQFDLDANGKLLHKPNDPDWQLYQAEIPEPEQSRIRNQYQSRPYVYARPEDDPEWVKRNLKVITATLAEFGKLAKERGQRFGLLYISNYGNTEKAYERDGQHYDPERFRTIGKQMAEEAGIEFIDISEQIHMKLKEKDADRMYFRGDGHLTPYGHYRYGQALGDMLSSVVNAE